MTTDSRVQLAVYDLSRGMARGLSRQILGQQIDGIWHTGIVVYGKEYYFGGGIQRTNWGIFAQMNQLPPDQVLEMGTTSKSMSELENFLRTIQHRFTNATYDLINNNCNHFANVVCQFLTGHGIPDHIVNLPSIVFSTPGGMMLRPMIEGMQNNIRQQYGHALDPFAGSVPTSSSAIPPPPSQPFEAALSSAVTSVALNALENTTTLQLAPLEEHPLISADASTVQAVGAKILQLPDAAGVKGQGLSAEERGRFQSILSRLSSSDSVGDFEVEDYHFMERLLTHHPAVHMPCLFVVRLMFLHDKLTDFRRLSIVREIIRRLLATSETSSASSGSIEQVNPFASVPAHVMALCSLSNLLSHDTGKAYLLGESSTIAAADSSEGQIQQQHFIDELIDVVLRGLHHDRSEVRQMSGTLAYNLTLACTREAKDATARPGVWLLSPSQDELHPQALQLLCGCFDGLFEEKDGLVRKRRLAVICRVTRAFPSLAASLIRELGFGEVLDAMKATAQTLSPPLTSEELAIVDELRCHLSRV